MDELPRVAQKPAVGKKAQMVLILVVMDELPRAKGEALASRDSEVLILVVMDELPRVVVLAA